MAQNAFGIDMGTSNIKIYNKNTDSVLNEKNIIAVQNKTKIYAFGDEAYEMYEKAPDSIVVSYPVKFGVIADIQNMQTLFEQFIKKSKGPKFLYQTGDFCVAVPTDITEVEKRAFYDLVHSAKVKAKRIMVVEKPVADGVGAGIDVDSPKGNMIVNFGADTTEISVISLGGIVISKICPLGGNRLDESICSIVRKKYNLIIGMKTAENLKKKLGNATNSEDTSANIYGRDLVSGLPVETAVSAAAVFEATNDILHNIILDIKMILERTPPELAADIIDTGIFLTGGSASFKNFDLLIRNETELNVNVPERPAECIVRGTARILSDPVYAGLAYVPREKIIN